MSIQFPNQSSLVIRLSIHKLPWVYNKTVRDKWSRFQRIYFLPLGGRDEKGCVLSTEKKAAVDHYITQTLTPLHFSTGRRQPDFTFLLVDTTALFLVDVDQTALLHWSAQLHFSWSTSTRLHFLDPSTVDARRRPFYCPFHHAPLGSSLELFRNFWGFYYDDVRDGSGMCTSTRQHNLPTPLLFCSKCIFACITRLMKIITFSFNRRRLLWDKKIPIRE